jgi:glycosyltransferase involved in cell wall biosynthesis
MMEVAESAKALERTGAEPSALRDTPVFLMTNTLETGGSERQFALLAQSLRAHGVRVELGCIERRGPLVESLPAMPEFRLYGRLYSLRSLGTRVALGKHLRRTGIKVAHAFDFYTNILLAPVARLAGVPVVLGSHRQVGDLLSPAKFRAQLAAFRFCDRVLCNSQAAADRLHEAGIPKIKLTIVPNIIPQPFFEPARPLLPAREGRVRIGMVARMNDASKRHEFLLDVMAELQRRVPNAELVLAGDGPLRAALEEKARSLGVSEQVMFVGDQTDIPAVLASLDVSVLTSASESRSNAILESMASGLPVVATDCPGNREIIGDGQSGFLLAADDRAAWVQALERLATDHELRLRFGTRGRSAVEHSCSVSAVRGHYEQLYSDLLREKGKRAAGDGV